MQTLTLNDRNEIPILGFGTYKATGPEGVESVRHALMKGYRLIDSAAVYGNESAVGEGVKASGIAREEIFITTKLWRESLGYSSARKEFANSLTRLGLDYLDLYLIHWPANARNYEDWQKTNADTWRAMEELQAEGKIRSIGVSNFWVEHLEALMQTAKAPPAVNQIEFHPGYWQPKVTTFCQEHNIAVESWSPLARGKVFGNELLKSIAQQHKRTVSQICLRWVIQHNVIAIPKSTTPERVEENINVFDFKLSEGEMNQIDKLPEMGFSGELPNIWPERIPKT